MRSKLPIEEQRRIVMLDEEGWPIRAICRETGHCYSAVRNVLDDTGANTRRTLLYAYSKVDKNQSQEKIEEDFWKALDERMSLEYNNYLKVIKN